MKLAEKTVDVQSNIQFDESVAVSIDESAVSMVIERLISAYKNPYRAALREYTSNAYDEHVASGQTAPVEVSLPDPLSPVLKVQDFGRGLNREELKGFGTIGMSTKRDSNEFTGGFGMGSKCALAAASQFTVVSVKDGKRNTVIIARDENNVPHMNFLPESETEDASGTTVIVPISDVSKFGDLTDFFVGWKPGTILVDDEQPKRSVYDSQYFRDQRGLVYDDLHNVSSGGNMVRLLINQVYYLLDYRQLGLSHTQWNLLKYKIIRVDNGSVDIAPSREDLLYNARTKAALTERFNEVLSLSSKEMIKSVANAETLRAALQIRDRMASSGFPVDGLKWKGQGLVLPGDTVKGNKVPHTFGTWVSPLRVSTTKSGYRVEKTWGEISRREVWRYTPDRSRFMIVYSASDPERYGVRNRMAHREASGVADYLNVVDSESDYSWDVFIVSEPMNRINRIYRDLADSVISAKEFNETVSKYRAEIRAAEKRMSDEKKSHHKLTLFSGSDYYYGQMVEMEVKDVKDEYDRVVILRNRIGGLEEHIRSMITTKKNHNSSGVGSINVLRKKHKVGVILAGKNDDLSEYYSLLPPITTFQDLAAQEIKAAIKDKTKIELMAERDRNKYSMYSITALSESSIQKIRSQKTRNWAEAVRQYKDDTSSVRKTYGWFAGWSETVKNALEMADSKNEKKSIPESPMRRYPLLENISSYRINDKDVIDYINMADAAAKA